MTWWWAASPSGTPGASWPSSREAGAVRATAASREDPDHRVQALRRREPPSLWAQAGDLQLPGVHGYLRGRQEGARMERLADLWPPPARIRHPLPDVRFASSTRGGSPSPVPGPDRHTASHVAESLVGSV